MRTRRLLVLAASACLGLSLFATPAVPAGATPSWKEEIVYHSVDVGTVLPGATDTAVTGVIPHTDVATPALAWRAVGTYRDTTGRHGFVADLREDFTLESALPIDVGGSPEVHVTSINAGGTISGYYRGTSPGAEVEHGFLRAPDGTITPLDDPHAETATRDFYVSPNAPEHGDQFYGGTYPMQVADDGTVTGFYSVTGTSPRMLHGFIWTTSDGFTTVDAPDTLSTALFGMTSDGLRYGGATVPVPNSVFANDRGVTLSKHDKATFYVDTAVPEPLPGNFCGWTTVTGSMDKKTLVGNAGNGCAIYGYAWLLRGKKYTNLVYTDASSTSPTTATETIVTGITRDGLMTGSWTQWDLSELGGNYLSPDGYTLNGETGALEQQGPGWWHGFIAEVP